MFAAVAYNLLLLLAGPLLALYLLYRLGVQGKSRDGLLQRLGASPRLGPPPAAGRLWLHAVSAGEVVAAAAIARRLAAIAPEVQLVISVTTPAGMQQAERLIPNCAARFFFPFDLLPCIFAALLRVRPTAIAAVETEIWPNWLAVARLLGIRTALVNGQFADKGFKRARKARWLYRWALGRLDALQMQTERAAERARFLGAAAERVRVVGNVKFEQAVSGVAEDLRALVQQRLGTPVWLAGSTHPGEEEQVLEAFGLVRAAVPGAGLLLAPRHIERAGDVAEVVSAGGWSVGRRSDPSAVARVDVLVLDTMGELAGLYALADVVFVGGSLVPIGGHDILQPLFHGKPTLFGPHMHNQHDLARLSLEAGAVRQIADAAELAAATADLLTRPDERDELRLRAEALLAANAGAVGEAAALLARLAAPGACSGSTGRSAEPVDA